MAISVLGEHLLPHSPLELLKNILGEVEGRLFVESINRLLEVDQASVGSFLEDAKRRGRLEATLLGCLVTLPLVDEDLIRLQLEGQ